ncbi:hypothetical protein [Spiroplasma ixodetis]|nr:hypothetical protein [Spiroplasma ixodetis]
MNSFNFIVSSTSTCGEKSVKIFILSFNFYEKFYTVFWIFLKINI